MNPARGQPSPSRNASPEARTETLLCKVSKDRNAAVRRLVAEWECSINEAMNWFVDLGLAEAAKGRRPQPPE